MKSPLPDCSLFTPDVGIALSVSPFGACPEVDCSVVVRAFFRARRFGLGPVPASVMFLVKVLTLTVLNLVILRDEPVDSVGSASVWPLRLRFGFGLAIAAATLEGCSPSLGAAVSPLVVPDVPNDNGYAGVKVKMSGHLPVACRCACSNTERTNFIRVS